MKRGFLGFVIFVFLIALTSATTVNLSADKTEVQLGEEIKLHLEIRPTKAIGGVFSINKEVGPKRFKLVQILFSRSSCSTCGGYNPLSEDFERDFYFEPELPGNYYAEANFGGVRDKVNFTVFTPTTTTTSPTSTSTTTATSSTITTTSTTPTTLLSPTITTTPEKSSTSVQEILTAILILLGAILIFILIAIIVNR